MLALTDWKGNEDWTDVDKAITDGKFMWVNICLTPLRLELALTTASTAFVCLKRAFQAGRDIESMTGDLSRWMGAVSDIEQKESQLRTLLSFVKYLDQ